MNVQNNINGNRIAYEYPYADTLTKDEQELYWSATEKAENSMSRIWQIQERRIDENGEISHELVMDDFRELREAVDQLGESITYLNLIEKSADWSDQMAENRKVLLEEMGWEDDSEGVSHE